MKNRTNIRFLVQLSLLAAVELVMAYTPLGYFRTPGLEISFLMVPVTLGAILLGPGAGAVLGAVFGLTSFGTCFGSSPFGAVLLGINPFFTFLVCVVARILAGWLAGLLFRALFRSKESAGEKTHAKQPVFPFAAAALAGPVLNTLFFMTGLVVFFYNTDYIQQIAAGMGAANPFMFVVLFVGLQGLIEAAAGFFIGTVLGKAVYAYLHRHP